jgi:transglutaminase-like putative cysteine protease
MHRTEYHYGQAMADGFTSVHLAPRATPSQSVLSVDLHVDPSPDEIEHLVDVFGNPVTHFAVHRPHDFLVVESRVEVEVLPVDVLTSSASWSDVAAAAASASGPLALEVGPFLAHTAQTPFDDGLAALTAPEFTPGRGAIGAASGLCARIFGEFGFDPGFSDVATPVASVLAARRGVCQDFAHVATAALRSMGLPARYVSGYIETTPPPGQPRMVGVDASHAWCSVWTGDTGWLDFDPTNNQMPPQRHVTIGWGRDYDDVAPVRGVVIGPSGGQTLTVAVDVAALD